MDSARTGPRTDPWRPGHFVSVCHGHDRARYPGGPFASPPSPILQKEQPCSLRSPPRRPVRPAGDEGAVVSGYPSDQTENAVQADVVAAGHR
ncbi:arabinofuranosidase catalytic domain-containing protein [Streptomyces odontomachi]|uniref:arabinofuranosidase catalytic domain-containing protein n=1 Tax=Streptomyces odontomachi TaxID=2944940 RepID=UPI00210AC4CE|nr:arabinofuranosidase catalytic domain-containing protein [Streptomyces sp. ODS25]